MRLIVIGSSPAWPNAGGAHSGYVVETERRFYLANEVEQVVREVGGDFYFELTLTDVWVWDVYRSDRFVKSVKVLTFKDVNVEELGKKDLKLPKELALDE